MAGNPTMKDPGDSRVVVVADMLFASRVRGAAQAAGVVVATAVRPDALERALATGAVRLVLVDLELRSTDPASVIRKVRSDPALADVIVIGFASHTNVQAIAAGKEAGAHRVLARSAFVQALPDLLRDANEQ